VFVQPLFAMLTPDDSPCAHCSLALQISQMIGSDSVAAICEASHRMIFKKGETILRQGIPSTHLVFLHRGIVKFSYETAGERKVILTVVGSPTLLGGANLFFNEKNLFSLVALEECKVCLIDNSVLMGIMTREGNFLMTLMKHSSASFQASIFNFINLAHKQVAGRISDILLYLSDNVYKSRRFVLSLTRRELSEFAACSPENVINTLSMLNREGVLRVSGKEIEILDYEKLAEISKHG